MLRLLDALLLLDCVKNSKPSLATDFAWYKGLFAQVSNAPDAVNPEADNHDLLQVEGSSRPRMFQRFPLLSGFFVQCCLPSSVCFSCRSTIVSPCKDFPASL